MDDWFPHALKLTTRAIEFGGIAIIVLGIVGATIFGRWLVLRGRPGSQVFSLYRSNLGRAFLWDSNSSSPPTSSTRLPSSRRFRALRYWPASS